MTRWFRMYDEMLDDPKVQLLSPELFKTWVNLLSLASRNNGVLLACEQLAFALRSSTQDTQMRLDDLVMAGLIDIRPDGKLEPHNWPKRQYASDSSAERMRRHRAKTSRDGRVTSHVASPPANSDAADTDTEEERDNSLPSESGTAREVQTKRFDLKGVGVGSQARREISPAVRLRACKELGISDAEPLVSAYLDWPGSRKARDLDAHFLASAPKILANMAAGLRKRIELPPPDTPAVAPVRPSSSLLQSLKGRAHAH